MLYRDDVVPVHDIYCPPIVAPWQPAPVTRAEQRELVDSLERVGQLDNLLVVHTGRSQYALIAGRRCYEAARILDWDLIGVKVVADARVAAMPSDARLHALAYSRLAHRRHLAAAELETAAAQLKAAAPVALGRTRENVFGVLYRDAVVEIANVYAPPVDALWRPAIAAADLAELAASLEAVGQLDNLLVVAAGDERYRLVAGRGRYAAARALGWQYIGVKIVADARDGGMPAAHQLQAIAESRLVHRRHLDPVSLEAARDLARRAVELARQLEDRTDATPTLVPLATTINRREERRRMDTIEPGKETARDRELRALDEQDPDRGAAADVERLQAEINELGAELARLHARRAALAGQLTTAAAQRIGFEQRRTAIFQKHHGRA